MYMSVKGGDDIMVPGDDQLEFAVEFDPQSETYRLQFDMDSQLPSEAVISVVAHASGDDPLNMPPIFRVVDPDALDSIFPTTDTGARRPGTAVTFRYLDFEVTVHSQGAVDLRSAY